MRFTLITAAVAAGLFRTCVCDEVVGYSELANDLLAPLAAAGDTAPNLIRDIFNRQTSWCSAGTPYVLCSPRTCCKASDNWLVLVSPEWDPGYLGSTNYLFMFSPCLVHRLGAAPRLPRRAVGESAPNPVLSAVGVLPASQDGVASGLLQGKMPAAGVPLTLRVMATVRLRAIPAGQHAIDDCANLSDLELLGCPAGSSCFPGGLCQSVRTSISRSTSTRRTTSISRSTAVSRSLAATTSRSTVTRSAATTSRSSAASTSTRRTTDECTPTPGLAPRAAGEWEYIKVQGEDNCVPVLDFYCVDGLMDQMCTSMCQGIRDQRNINPQNVLSDRAILLHRRMGRNAAAACGSVGCAQRLTWIDLYQQYFSMQCDEFPPGTFHPNMHTQRRLSGTRTY